MNDMKSVAEMEVDFAECECCGLIEECTPSYIQAIQKRYGGKWICGLCAEAVKDEVLRCEKMVISPDEALARHLSFCNKVRAWGRTEEDPTLHLIRAMRQVLRKSLESPRALSSIPINSPTRVQRGNMSMNMNMNMERRSDACISNLTSMYCEMEGTL